MVSRHRARSLRADAGGGVGFAALIKMLTLCRLYNNLAAVTVNTRVKNMDADTGFLTKVRFSFAEVRSGKKFGASSRVLSIQKEDVMKRVIYGAVVLSMAMAMSGCATSFSGSAYVDGPAECKQKCEKWGMDLAGMVSMGAYTDGCICKAK